MNNALELKSDTPIHALVSPSGMWAVKICPYTAKLCYGEPDRESEASKRGTLLHEAVYNDEVLASLEGEDKKIVEDIRDKFIKPIKDNPQYKINHELRLELHDKEGKLLTWGLIDYLVVSNNGKTGQLLDWKFGFKPVDTFWYNAQLKCYSAMAYQNFPKLKEIYSMPVQPAVGISFDNMAHSTREENYEDFLKEAEEVVKLGTEATEADAKPNGEVCCYCLKDKCPAYQRQMLEVCRAYNIELDKRGEELASLPPKEAVIFANDKKKRLDMAKAVIKEIEGELNRLIIINGGSEDYRVVNPSMRRVVDWEALARELGATEEQIEAKTMLVSSGGSYLRRKGKK